MHGPRVLAGAAVLIGLVGGGAGAVVAFVPPDLAADSSPADQCDRPLWERVGGWVCYDPPAPDPTATPTTPIEPAPTRAGAPD
ncbi:hypothetical protein [Actinopolymorpha pittospori]|uniref:Uncharacterized protein n=1 Tax=Actinopolymorpha pittospori TaxID=648752 RepID=A0A927MU62_9ACTN|nr:hypothetical protein [Actinopolymorpha pittospori]MBE1604903.1 hypothetical protein [Actinopolymorpha pittospori]